MCSVTDQAEESVQNKSSSKRTIWLPEAHLLVCWIASLATIFAWQRYWLRVGLIDQTVTVVVHWLYFPLLCRKMTPLLHAGLYSMSSGSLLGFQVIDLCFDLVVMSKTSGLQQLTWLYYHTILNSSHVNAVLLAAMLQTGLGSLIGLTRHGPMFRINWILMIACNFLGFGCYFAFVVPRYLEIRESADMKTSVLEGWEVVFRARIWMFLCLGLGMASCLYMKLTCCHSNDFVTSKLHDQ